MPETFEQVLFSGAEFADNPEPRCACLLLLDTSGSMRGNAIDELNADLDRFPPPVPIAPTTALGRWSRSSIREVLRNPKYTGYQVYRYDRDSRRSGR